MIQRENFPADLLIFKNWCVWDLRDVNGRITKLPYNPRTLRLAKSNDFSTWCSFEEAARAVEGGAYKGVGFMLSSSPYVCVDLDDCLDGGEREAWARGIVAALGSYTEVSQSGKGLHIFGRANVAHDRRSDRIEVYGNNRFIAMTGNIYEGHGELKPMQGALDALMASELPAKEKPAGTYSKTSKTPHEGASPHVGKAPQGAKERPAPRVEQVIRRLRHGKSAEQFAEMFDKGVTNRYPSQSEADLALMNMIAFAADGNVALMLEVFSTSAFGAREKWQQRADYRADTVMKARAGWVEHQLAFLPMTDTGNAQRLELLHGDNIAYLPEKGKGSAWMVWDGKRWEASFESSLYGLVSDTAAKAKRAFESLAKLEAAPEVTIKANATDSAKDVNAAMRAQKQHLRDVRAAYKEKEKAHRAALAFFVQSGNQFRIDACLKRSRGLFEASINDFDRDPYALNTQNGIIDLKKGMLHPHDRARLCSRIARAEYRPELIGKPSLWSQTVAQIIPDEEERAYMQKWAGYLLIGAAPEEKLLFLYGAGGSGKGTFINTIAYALGDYADTVDIEVFLASRNDGHGGGSNASPEIAKLAGIRAAMASESGIGRKLNDAKVKNMTGRDDLTARFLYGQQFSFTPVVKFVLSSNYLPSVHDSTDVGMRRRLVIAPFMENLEDIRDIHLKERLKTPDELAAVLAWCVEGCLKWQKEGLGIPPRRFLQQAGMFYADSDTLQQFLDDECCIGEKCRAKVKDFYDSYALWSGERVKKKTVIEMMRRKGHIMIRHNDGRFFRGVELKPGGFPY